MITNSHLKTHEHTTESYLKAFPEFVLCDDVMKRKYARTRKKVKQAVCAKPDCKECVATTQRTYCSRRCAMSHRLSHEGRAEQSGSKNKQFTDGWYSTGKRRKQEAKERDGYKCRRCGVKENGKGMHAHHVIPERCFDDLEEAHDLDNLIALCASCHKKIEWEMIRELYQRALQLDDLRAGDTDYESFAEFKERLTAKRLIDV